MVAIPAHVQLGDCHGNVVDWQPPLQEQILAHVGESRGRIDGVPTNSITLQVWCGVATL